MLPGYISTLLWATAALLAALLFPIVTDLLTWTAVFEDTLFLNNDKCHKLKAPQLLSCEDGEYHPESKKIYFSCGLDNEKRRRQFPPVGKHDNSVVHHGGVVVMDPETEEYQLLNVPLDEFGAHGISVISDPDDPQNVLIALVNHKRNASVIERFELEIGSEKLKHIETIQDPLLFSPNAIQQIDRNTFYATNDAGTHEGLNREIERFTRRPWSYVVYYDGKKMKKAATDIVYANGIAASADKQTIWVVSCTGRKLLVFERKENNNLRPRDEVEVPAICDNIRMQHETGNMFCAGNQKGFPFLGHVKNPEHKCPSTVFRISNNTNKDSFYGKKYNVERIFAEDGTLVSAASAIVVTKTKYFVSGVFGTGIVVCNL